MTVTDYVFIVVDVALWVAIAWHGLQARAVGELWWSCVCLALIITMKIGVIADPFNQATGGIYLDELLGHLLGVIVAALTMSWLVLIRHGSHRPYRTLRFAGTGAVLVFLLATWFLGPIYDIPAEADWIPPEVRAAPILVVHWLVLQAFLVVFAVVFMTVAGKEATRLPPGYVRLSLRLLLGAAALLAICLGAGVVGKVVALAGGSQPRWLDLAQNLLLLGVFALFLLAVAIPLTRRGGPDGTTRTTDERVASLWTWIQEAAGQPGPETHATLLEDDARPTLFDQVIDIRDQIWFLQRFIEPSDVAEAAHRARAQGLLFGTRARAFTTAACLALAAQRHAGQSTPVAPPPANLASLGGGRTIAQEAHWLAAVSDALPRVATATARPS